MILFGLGETRDTLERKAGLDHHIFSNCVYLSSFIDRYKGGVGLLVKHDFLKNFWCINEEKDFQVISAGRIIRLVLRGATGSLHIYVVYLDPSAAHLQIADIKLLGKSLDRRAHSIILGDFNFVEADSD